MMSKAWVVGDEMLSTYMQSTYQGEDISGFMQCGHFWPVIAFHEGEAGTVWLGLWRDGAKERGEHVSVGERVR